MLASCHFWSQGNYFLDFRVFYSYGSIPESWRYFLPLQWEKSICRLRACLDPQNPGVSAERRITNFSMRTGGFLKFYGHEDSSKSILRIPWQNVLFYNFFCDMTLLMFDAYFT